MAQFYSAKRRVTTRQIITVTVNDLDPFGQGVARHQGKALFVSGVLPHEQAEVALVEDKKQYARAEVKRRLTDSPQRQAPRCPHFGVCGGCQQQHASVLLQQQSKRAALGRLMKREVDDVIAGAPWGYRRRARLSLNYQPKTQQLQMGFRQANAKAIVDVVQCPVLAPQLEALLPAVRECLSALSALRHLGHVELVQADNGPLMVLRHTAALPATDREKLECFSQTHGLSLYLAPQSEILEHIHGEAPWYTSDGLRLVFSPRDFIQVNDGVNQQMVRTALEWLDLRPEDRVLDLFCGMATLPCRWRHAPPMWWAWKGCRRWWRRGGKTPPAMVYQMSLSSMKIWKKTSPVRPGRSTALIKCCWTRPAPRAGRDAAYNKTGTAAGGVCFLQPGDAGARQRNPVAGWISDSTPGDAGYVPAYRPSGINGVV